MQEKRLTEKLHLKSLIQTSRCIVPADGYYEWKREDKNKIYLFLFKEDNEIMFFAIISK